MKRTMVVIVGIALFAGAGAAISKNPDAEADRPLAAGDDTAAAVSRGAKAWAENCGSCHNIRSPRELGDAQWQVAATHMRVRANLPGDVTRDITAFLQASNGAGPAAAANVAVPDVAAPSVPAGPSSPARAGALTPPDPVNGGRIYRATCVACHGANGKGAFPGVPDFTAAAGRLSKPDAVLLRNMTNGFQTPGSPMPMPARGGNPDLTNRDMADVLAYLRATFGRRQGAEADGPATRRRSPDRVVAGR